MRRTIINVRDMILPLVLVLAALALTSCDQADDSPSLTGITAVYTGTSTIYPDTSLDTFKTNLIVTAVYSDDSLKAVKNYTLDGTLAVGQSVVTVAYEGETTTFTVKVDDPPAEDTFVGVDNPFIGTWQAGATEYWQFRTDGTGSKVTKGNGRPEKGPFLDDFSFLVYYKTSAEGIVSTRTLVMLSENTDSSTSSADPFTFNRYTFTIEDFDDDDATLTGVGTTDVTLERVNGSPQPLDLKNPIIGEWLADWDGSMGFTWSMKFQADGTAKAYNQTAGHQGDIVYALRGDVLVLFGAIPRYSTNPVTSRINIKGNGKFEARETKNFPPTTNGMVNNWLYTKVASAPWLPANTVY